MEIGRRKYEALKSFDLENLTEESIETFEQNFPGLSVAEALKSIDSFENKNTNIDLEKVSNYFEEIKKPKEKEKIELTKEILWKMFTKAYRLKEGVEYSKEPFSLENLKPLIYYFIGDLKNFKQCDNVSHLSKPSLKKGLLIIGGYGNGKTSVMRAFEQVLKKSNVKFSGYTTNEIVMMFEAIQDNHDKEAFYKKMRSGVRYFDDVLTEREASNFGKVNLMKEIIEERYNKGLKTYITCNYKDDTDNDLDQGLEQFGERYGSRVYDRLFEMFNIIEFKGKSFR